SLGQIKRIDALANSLGIKALWAGGLGLGEVYEMGRLGVFGVYGTSAASESVAVPHSYARDPALFSVKEPTYEGVLHPKLLLEAGFLVDRISNDQLSIRISKAAKTLLVAIAEKSSTTAVRDELARDLVQAWRLYQGGLPKQNGAR